MTNYEKMKALISQINDESTKKELDQLLGDINKEKGTALSDLMEIKKKAKDLEGDNLTIKEMMKIFKEKGAEITNPNDILEIAKKLNLKQDDGSATAAYAEIINKQKEDLEKIQTELKNYKINEIVMPKLELAKKEFKDKDGKPVSFIETFIDKLSLTKDIDISNEVLVNAKIKNVLEDSYNKQTKFLTDNGLLPQLAPVHEVKTSTGGITSDKGIIPVEEAKKFFKENGSDVNALAQLFAMHDQKIKT